MRQCKISKKIKNGYETQPLPGVFVFRGWSQRGELVTRTASGEISGEGCIDPVPIIEDADGRVHVVDADRVVFLEGEEVTDAMAAAAIEKAVACCLIPPLSSQVTDSCSYHNLFSSVIKAALNAREAAR